MVVKLSEAAKLDLADIYFYTLTNYTINRVEKLQTDIQNTISKLHSAYDIYPVLKIRSNGMSIRVKHHKRTYSVYFEVDDSAQIIVVLRIWHNSRNPKDLMLPLEIDD